MTDQIKLDLPAIYGLKAGMTRIFDETGAHVPVTVVKLIPNVVSQVKTKEKDGYEAYQIAYLEKKAKLVNTPFKGHLKKANISQAFSKVSEIKILGVNAENLGKQVTYGLFTANTYVDVTGINKGKGFQGVMKRFGFHGGPASHGSHFHRRPGSIGNRATPARVFAEKPLPGHMGTEKITMQNLVVIETNVKDGYMLIKGSIPGSKNGIVRIATAIKHKADK